MIVLGYFIKNVKQSAIQLLMQRTQKVN